MITVVIPSNVCNSWLEEAINSVLRSVCDFEIEIFLILNNLDSNNEKNLKELKKRYGSKIRVANLGQVTLSDALNYGVEKAKFDLIARLDSDDTMSQTRLQRQFDFLSRNKEVALVGSAVILMNQDSRIIGKRIYPISDAQIKACLRFGNCMAHPALMFRRNVFIEVGGYSNEFPHSEDFDLLTRIARLYQIVNLSEFLTNYRVFNGQISYRFVASQEVNSLAIIRREFQSRGHERMYKLVLAERILKSRYLRSSGLRSGTVQLVFWTLMSLLFNFRPTLYYVRQGLLNSRIMGDF